MATTNQKSIIDTHTKKGKKSKHTTKDSHHITREENERRKRKKDLQKQIQNNCLNGNKNIDIDNYLKCKWKKMLQPKDTKWLNG